MKQAEFVGLKEGDMIENTHSGSRYVVVANHEGVVTGVRSTQATNPDEWVLVAKSRAKMRTRNSCS